MAYAKHSTICFMVICGILHVCIEAKDLKFSTVLSAPYLYEKNDGTYVGFLPDLFERMHLNVSIEVNPEYGSKGPNGTWTGLVADILDQKADFAGPLTVTVKRMEAVDFSYPLTSVGPVIVMRKQDTKRSMRDDITLPFRPMEANVWMLLSLCFLVTGTTLYIISHFNPYEWRRMGKDREATLREQESFTCFNSFWFVLSAFSLQGYVRTPRSMGARVLVLAWWFFVLIMLFFYVANLVNFLRASSSTSGHSKIRGFKDLARNEEIRIAMVYRGATEEYFRNSVNDQDQDIYRRLDDTRTEIAQYDPSESDKMKTGGRQALLQYLRTGPFSDFTLILESDMATYYTNQLPCDLFMIHEGRVNRQLAFAFAKGSNTLEADLNQKLLSLQETGVIKELTDKWFSSECSDTGDSLIDSTNSPSKAHAVGLADISGAILVLVVGIVLGGIITAIEFCIYRWAEPNSDEDVDRAQKPRNLDVSDQLLAGDSRSGAQRKYN